MITLDNRGGEGVLKGPKSDNVICVRSLIFFTYAWKAVAHQLSTSLELLRVKELPQNMPSKEMSIFHIQIMLSKFNQRGKGTSHSRTEKCKV